MRYLRSRLLGGLATTLFLSLGAGATDINRIPCPHCQATAGYGLKEVVEHRCRLIEETKPLKKTVYECKEVPYCLHKLPKFGHCDSCPDCQACPKYKKVLLKKEITCGEKRETKCVVEEITHKVPCCNHCQARLENPEPTLAVRPSEPESPRIASPPIRIEQTLR